MRPRVIIDLPRKYKLKYMGKIDYVSHLFGKLTEEYYSDEQLFLRFLMRKIDPMGLRVDGIWGSSFFSENIFRSHIQPKRGIGITDRELRDGSLYILSEVLCHELGHCLVRRNRSLGLDKYAYGYYPTHKNMYEREVNTIALIMMKRMGLYKYSEKHNVPMLQFPPFSITEIMKKAHPSFKPILDRVFGDGWKDIIKNFDPKFGKRWKENTSDSNWCIIA